MLSALINMSITIFSQDQKKEEELKEKIADQKDSDQPQKTEAQTPSPASQPKKTEPSQQTSEAQPYLEKEHGLLSTETIKEAVSLESEIKDTEKEISENIKKANDLSPTIQKERSTRKSLVAFAPKPIRAHFDAQLKEETIVLMLRQHPITQISKVIMVFLALFFPILLFASPFLDFLQPRYKAAVVVAWYLALSGVALEIFLSWYFHVFFITDRRVIDVDFHSMVHKDVASAKLENIQDVSYTTAGVLASLIDYGTAYLQTAGSQAKIEFEKVPKPAKVAKVLNELIAEKKRRMRGRARI